MLMKKLKLPFISEETLGIREYDMKCYTVQ